MNIITTFKTLPVIGALVLGLALAPNVALAEKGDRGNHKGQYSQDTGKTHNKARKNNKQHKVHVNDRHGHKNLRKGHNDKYYSQHNSRKHNRHGSHAHRDNHRHGYGGHTHSHYVVNHHDHHDRYIDFDDLRFMIGLHTDNFDIILRD